MSLIDKRLPASFRDPNGFMYQKNGKLLRQINLTSKEDYNLLISSGLYKKLLKKNMLISHVDVDVLPFIPEVSYKIIQPEKIKFISYPYEWSFSQLKDAALLTLAIQKEALNHGMQLRDASAYNIQFHLGSPILIDTLSFTEYHEGDIWVAYRQFCQHFLSPLALMSQTDFRLSKLLQIYIDGIPLDLSSKLLPWTTWLNFGLFSHIHLHAKSQQHYSNTSDKEISLKTRKKMSISKIALTGLIESLEKTVERLTWKISKTEWADYYNATNYSDASFEEKKQIVGSMLKEISPNIIWDLGSNTGLFSKLASDFENCLAVSADIDPGAVELNYLECKKNQSKDILPLILDLTNPTPAIGWKNEERESFFQRGPVDVVLALALVHHLAIANNVPLEDISCMMASLGKYVIIEFVPKEDSQVKRLLSSREDIFENYNDQGFIKAFQHDFELLDQVQVTGTYRTIFLFKRKNF